MFTLPIPGKLSAIVATLIITFMLGLLSTPIAQAATLTKAQFTVSENAGLPMAIATAKQG